MHQLLEGWYQYIWLYAEASSDHNQGNKAEGMQATKSFRIQFRVQSRTDAGLRRIVARRLYLTPRQTTLADQKDTS